MAILNQAVYVFSVGGDGSCKGWETTKEDSRQAIVLAIKICTRLCQTINDLNDLLYNKI